MRRYRDTFPSVSAHTSTRHCGSASTISICGSELQLIRTISGLSSVHENKYKIKQDTFPFD